MGLGIGLLFASFHDQPGRFFPIVAINWRFFCQDHIMKHMVILSSLITLIKWSVIQLKSGPASWVTLCKYYSIQTFHWFASIGFCLAPYMAEKFGRLNTWFIIASDRACFRRPFGWAELFGGHCVRARAQTLQTSQCSLSERAQWQEKVLGGKNLEQYHANYSAGKAATQFVYDVQTAKNITAGKKSSEKIHVLCAVIIEYSLKNRVMAHYLFGISWPIQESQTCRREKKAKSLSFVCRGHRLPKPIVSNSSNFFHRKWPCLVRKTCQQQFLSIISSCYDVATHYIVRWRNVVFSSNFSNRRWKAAIKNVYNQLGGKCSSGVHLLLQSTASQISTPGS